MQIVKRGMTPEYSFKTLSMDARHNSYLFKPLPGCVLRNIDQRTLWGATYRLPHGKYHKYEHQLLLSFSTNTAFWSTHEPIT